MRWSIKPRRRGKSTSSLLFIGVTTGGMIPRSCIGVSRVRWHQRGHKDHKGVTKSTKKLLAQALCDLCVPFVIFVSFLSYFDSSTFSLPNQNTAFGTGVPSSE